jgi:hypothetical protein
VNVTIVLPPSLRPLMEGRAQIELGVPLTADVGDLLQTLFTLYPRLRRLQADERRPQGHVPLQLFATERTLQDLFRRRGALREGERFYLSGLLPKEGRSVVA